MQRSPKQVFGMDSFLPGSFGEIPIGISGVWVQRCGGPPAPHMAMGLEDPHDILEPSEFHSPTGELGKGSGGGLIKYRVGEHLNKSEPPEERRNEFSNRNHASLTRLGFSE